MSCRFRVESLQKKRAREQKKTKKSIRGSAKVVGKGDRGDVVNVYRSAKLAKNTLSSILLLPSAYISVP